MTPDQMRVAIAEACGWIISNNKNLGWKKEFVGESARLLPDYPNDLNACQQFEDTLTHDQWRIYIGFLNGGTTIPQLMSMEDFHKCWKKKGEPRCIAFCKTIGKYKDSQ